MTYKVNPSTPNKIADRIAGALVDLAYTRQSNPKIDVNVMVGHGNCEIMGETSVLITSVEAQEIVTRIAGDGVLTHINLKPQDENLADIQDEYMGDSLVDDIRCADTCVIVAHPKRFETKKADFLAREVYEDYPFDGNVLMDGREVVVCQSCADSKLLFEKLRKNHPTYWVRVNPIGDWTGGTGVSVGMSNAEGNSDGAYNLHGKDLSKPSVSVGIWLACKADREEQSLVADCVIGNREIKNVPYYQIVGEAYDYIKALGGFEKLAEWGLI